MKEFLPEFSQANDFLQIFTNDEDFELPLSELPDMDFLNVPEPGLSCSGGTLSPQTCSSPDTSDCPRSPSSSPEVHHYADTSNALSSSESITVHPNLFPCPRSVPLVKVETEDLCVDAFDFGNEQRKKRKKSSSPTKFEPYVGKTSVSLPRDQLLEFSSEDLEAFVNSIKLTRPLTDEEKREISRQRRLIKNRESAMASRIRKKSHVDDLEKQVEELKHRNLQLQTRVTLLELENKQLQQQVESLSVQNQQDPKSESTASNTPLESHVNITFPSDFEEFAENLHINSPLWGSSLKANTMKATSGICLFILLFSFGLFFHNLHPSHLSNQSPKAFFEKFLPTGTQDKVLDFHYSHFSKKGSPLHHQSHKPGTGRVLLEKQDLEDPNKLDLEDHSEPPRNTCNTNENTSKEHFASTETFDGTGNILGGPVEKNLPCPPNTMVNAILAGMEVENNFTQGQSGSEAVPASGGFSKFM